jgi:hypothetical protein
MLDTSVLTQSCLRVHSHCVVKHHNLFLLKIEVQCLPQSGQILIPDRMLSLFVGFISHIVKIRLG